VTSGFSVSTPGGGGFFAPTKYIYEDGIIEVDGIPIEVTLTHDIGTPAELNLFFQEYSVLWVGECCLSMLHNIYTVRGAKPRDANAWSKYIYDLYVRYGDRAKAVLQSTNWPHKNTKTQPDAVKEYLLNTAAAYKRIHDQTLYYAARGYSADEIAKLVQYPEDLGKQMYVRPYYGSVEMGVHGTYALWFGDCDGNPVNLQRQSKEERARQFIEYVGSVQAVFDKAYADYEKGNYQRAIEALDMILFYDSDFDDARYLYADILEQMGYQAECATWRNAYLNGAKELRQGPRKIVPNKDKLGNDNILKHSERMSDEHMLDYLGLAVNTKKASDKILQFQLNIKGRDGIRVHYVELRHGALIHSELKRNAQSVLNYPEITTYPGILTRLVSHELDVIKPYIETKHMEILEELSECLDNPMDYLDYPIMEKRNGGK
jgi:alkyl sulfatase BDS1-like metallo-beta-lactamase superfamily hydrolase